MQSGKPVPVQPPEISYRGYRFPKEVIAFAVWLYFRFPLSLRMVEEMLAARGILVTYETVRRWADSLTGPAHSVCVLPGQHEATSGTSPRWWSRSTGACIGRGAPSTSTGLSWTFWYNRDETLKQPSA